MINPFEKIVAPDPGESEIIDGQFFCASCNKVSYNAAFFAEPKLLIWLCPDGHKNDIEGFELD